MKLLLCCPQLVEELGIQDLNGLGESMHGTQLYAQRLKAYKIYTLMLTERITALRHLNRCAAVATRDLPYNSVPRRMISAIVK